MALKAGGTYLMLGMSFITVAMGAAFALRFFRGKGFPGFPTLSFFFLAALVVGHLHGLRAELVKPLVVASSS